MILVKDRTGSKNGTADSTLVGVFDSKRPLYRLVKWLILHIFPPVFRLLYGFRVVGRIPEEKMENGCISVCNHVHKLDCVMLACVFQDYTMQFLSLESNLHIPVAGAIVRLMGGIGLPAKPDHRERVATEEEIERLKAATGWDGVSVPDNLLQSVILAFVLSCKTGMRAGEILKLEHSWIDGRVIHLPAEATKTSTRRDVALSLDAARLIELAINAKKTTSPKIFEGLTDKNRDAPR